ncbi:MAG: hypothetical protein HQ475_06090 [SAR202 cluster bacterium]|nr:hypothetical protein [SAR202 cluster bacterium]
MPESNAPPKLSAKLLKYFQFFVSTSNKSMLHPNDWGKFYNFISHAHSLRSKLLESDIKRLLVQEGFREEYASQLADVYDHGRRIIRVYNGSIPDGAVDEGRAAYERRIEQERNGAVNNRYGR